MSRRAKARRVAAALAALVALLPAAPARAAITVEVVATGLSFPAGFTFDPSGRIFYGERFSGEIRILTPSTGSDTLFFTVPNVVSAGEQGLLGIALHPGYPATPYVYAYATRNVSGTLRNQIVRITNSGGTGTAMKVIFSSSTVAGAYHDGGRILFGPDGMLYAVVGEAHSSSASQNLNNSAGKILRMTPAGKVPANNPIAGSRIYAYGIRNSFGFAFDPNTGKLWETENGPECNDELNLILPGKNYGWGPNETCSTPPNPPRNTNRDGPNPVMPKRWYTPTIAPTGLAFCDACGLGSGSNGRLFFGAWETGQIRKVALTSDRMGVAYQAVVYTHTEGVISVEVGPGGGLYFSDGSGIYKLVLS